MATKEADKPTGASTLTCPECGKTFTRPASLGAHRQRAHGVAGSSKNNRTAAAGTARRARTASSRNGRSTTATPQRRQARASKQDNGRSQAINRDALLKTLFPAGIPPREDVIGAVNNWLDEAERLAGLR